MKLENRTLIEYLYLTIAAIVGILIGILTSNYYHQVSHAETSKLPSEIHETGYKHISPLLGCSDAIGAPEQEIEKKMRDVVNRGIKEGKITYASVYFRDLNNGPWVGINEKEEFTPASLLKVPLMITYLKVAEKFPTILDEEIYIDDETKTLSQNIMPLRTVESGKAYRIEDLIEYMIVYSDNKAANALLGHIDAASISTIYENLGVKMPDINDSENFMSVRDYASFFRILYNASYLNREMSEKALNILTRSQYNLGLSAGVPPQVEIAHKFGERVLLEGKQLHDCGIVYKKDRPYLLCIMTRGNNFIGMSETIKTISETAYTEFE